MAISLAKLSVLVGAGLVGSVLSQEGRARDLLSGAYKIFVKQIKRTDSISSPSGSKPQNEALLAQVNNLRQELELLGYDSSPTIIMTGGTSGGISTYGPPLVIIIAVGYGIIWWKGWKISSLMFATKRDLNNHRTSVAKQADQVYADVKVTDKDVSAKMEDTNSRIDTSITATSEIKEEVANTTGDVENFSKDFQLVREIVTNLESQISNFEGKQDATYGGVYNLCNHVLSMKASPSTSKPALELPQTTPTPRLLHSTSMPTGLLSYETPSPSVQTLPVPPEPPTPSSSNASASTTSSRLARWGIFSRTSS
ncbi:hypothetical protein MKW94_027197 [Papaver nudicaule]|uniref:DUF1664 domain-containing protein n=1 Tax=Papaver nudicaule TaxID=74823 RepID=A0AA41SPY7_PAPNU|nr:hypothetical protein [Papaver nudicaule]